MLGILHLSDLHLKGDDDEIMYMHNEICSAITDKKGLINKLVITISGDIAFKGIKEEYSSAYYFIERLKEELQIEVKLFIVPGNHDCEFKDDGLRDDIIKAILRDKNLPSEHFVDVCCKVQYNYNEFVNEVDANSGNEIFTDDLVKIREIVIDDEKLIFLLLNTAWISKISEKPGELYFPIDKYIDEIREHNDGIVFTIFHHPSKWQHPDDSNNFDRKVESISDFILTGHEHFCDNYEKRSSNSNVVYFKGHALQKQEGMFKSGFSFIIIDTKEKEYQYSEFDFINSKYITVNEPQWISYEALLKNKNKNMSISNQFNDYLNDIGMNLNHPKKDNIKIDDIFIYPELEQIEYKKNEDYTTVVIKSEEFFAKDIDRPVVVYGDDKSGKTTLAKKIFMDSYYRGRTPIYMDISKLKRHDLYEVDKVLLNLFNTQYKVGTGIELDDIKDNIIIIVDNLERIDENSKARLKFIESLNKEYNKIIWFCKSIFSIDELIYEKDKKGIDISIDELRLKKFRRVLRNRLVHKWNIIGDRNAQYTDEFILQDEDKIRQIDVLLGKNYIPANPFYILVILQALEMGNEHSFIDSSYGYYYEYLILKTLNRLTKNNGEIDAINNFLITLSKYFYEKDIKDISYSDLDIFHRNFINDYRIPASVVKIYDSRAFIEGLCEENLMLKINERYEFKYKYIYYYYLAKYFSINIDKDDIRELISTMIDKLYIEEYANIIVFIIHLSKQEFILEKLVDISKNIFKNYKEVKLDKDIGFINELQIEIPQLVIENINPVEYREHRYDSNDLAESKIEEYDEQQREKRLDEKVEGIRQLNLAFKCMEISGQILKNYWGSLTGDVKKNIGVQLYSVGLRSLSEIYSVLDKAKQNLSKIIVENLSDKNTKSINNIELIEKQSKQMVFIFAAYFTDGMISKIADCIGDKNLTETYKDIEGEVNYNSVKLINLAIKLQYSNSSNFPYSDVEGLIKENKNNILVQFLIKHMVREFLYMYKVSKRDKQKITQLIGMNTLAINLKETKEILNKE